MQGYNKLKCPDSVRIAGKDKYPQKVMTWEVISSHGIASFSSVQVSEYQLGHLF